MPKNEDGEFELILANRQLLSVFFIVVILLGVFFTMGYIVGRNSGPAPVDVASHKPESKPMVVDSPAPPQESAAAIPTTPAPDTSAPTATKQQQPVPEEVKPEPAKVEEPVKKEPTKKEKAKEREREKEKAPPAPAAAPPATPASGQTYLQLVATAKAEADVMVDDPGVSRRHAEVHTLGGRLRVIDLGSTNGTYVDGEKVNAADLTDGSRIRNVPFPNREINTCSST